MFRPPRPRPTATVETGVAERAPVSQMAPGRLDPEPGRLVGEIEDCGVGSMSNCSQFGGLEPYTGVLDSGYYSNLLVNVVEESQDPTPPSDARVHHGRATAKSTRGRSKNFRDDEDILLMSAWLNLGMDPIQGVHQTHGTLWTRIHEYFNANKTFESNRSEGSLMNRWSVIQHDVNLFCGCLSRIEARNHSGWSVDDKIANACAMFKAEDPKERKFSYLHCWKILKDKPKWMERRNEIGNAKKTSRKKQKTLATSSPTTVTAPSSPVAGTLDGEPTARPDGKKKEKQKLRQRSTIEAIDYLMAKKKEADHEKELKKEERCNKAFAL